MVKPFNRMKLRFTPSTPTEFESESTHCPICFTFRWPSFARHQLAVSLWAIYGRIQGPEGQEQSKNQDDNPGFQKSRFLSVQGQAKYPGPGCMQRANSRCRVVPAVCNNQASHSDSAFPWNQCTSRKIKNKQPCRSKLCQCTGTGLSPE